MAARRELRTQNAESAVWVWRKHSTSFNTVMLQRGGRLEAASISQVHRASKKDAEVGLLILNHNTRVPSWQSSGWGLHVHGCG